MKAAVLTGVQSIEVKEVEEPKTPEGGLLIEVETCAICGTDVKMHRYGYAAAKLPLVPGHELAGKIRKTGAAGSGFEEGDRVTINPNIPCGICHYCRRGLQTACDNLEIVGVHRNGGFARYVAVPALAVRQGCVLRIPDGVASEDAALIDPASCAVNAAELSQVKPGDAVVIIGAGPAGCLNAEVCRAFGARKVIVVQRSAARLKQAEFTGADTYVNSSREDPVKKVMEETAGRGADAVIVACASVEAQEQAIRMVAKRGNVNLFGGLPKGSPAIQFDSNSIHYKESFVTGTHGGSNRHCEVALAMIASGKIRAGEYVSARLGLSEFHRGLKLAEEKQGLKVFIMPCR
jgi:L-iditol 2-dehydrogenase